MRATRAFFDVWYPRLVRYLRARVGDADQAEDIAQEAFVRLLEHRPANPGAWLFTVATNLARDDARIANGRRRHLALIAADPRPDDADPVAALMHDEAVARVRSALAQLADRDRALLLMHYEGMRYREIAACVGVAPSSVGSLLTRAQRRFVRRYELEENDHAREARR